MFHSLKDKFLALYTLRVGIVFWFLGWSDKHFCLPISMVSFLSLCTALTCLSLLASGVLCESRSFLSFY